MTDNTSTSYGSEDTKLTDWAKEPELRVLKEIFTESKSFHSKQMAKIKDWNDMMDASGKYAPPKNEGRSQVQPKLIRKQAEWRYSALTEPFLGSDKLFQCNPVTFEDEYAAKQHELLLNWQFRTKLNKVKFIDELIRATVDDGTSICRVGWERISIPEEVEVPVYGYYNVPEEVAEEYAMQLEELAQLKQSNPREYNETIPEEMQEAVIYFLEEGVPVEVRIEEYVTEVVERVLENKPTIEVLSPQDVYIDPTCGGNLDNAKFVVHTYETCKADLMSDRGTYQNIDKIQWDRVVPDSEYATATDFKFQDDMKNRVTVHEYWGYHDIHDNGILLPIVASWIGNVLIRMEESPFPDGKLPFVMAPYLPVKRHAYGEPDAELLKDNQQILGAVNRAMIDLLGGAANAQTGIPLGFLDLVNKRRFEAGEDYEYNPTGSLHPANAVHTHKMPEIPSSAISMYQIQTQEAESMSGVKSFSGGISGAAYGDVAAGIRGALDASSKREMAILRRLAGAVVSIGNKIIAMNSVFLSDSEVIRVTNSTYVEIKREDIKGNFDLIVDISTAEIDDAKSQDLAFMVQTVGPIAGPQASMQLIAEIAELKRMPELANRLRNFSFEPSEEDQMLKQLEIKKAELELAELESRINMNNTIAARNASEAEKKMLDKYEQESGTTHEREMEKQKAQSQGNQNLAITKALTEKRKLDELPPNIEAAIGHVELTELSNRRTTQNEVDNQHSVAPINNNEFMGR